jgi:Cu/Ag efflux protein CusF
MRLTSITMAAIVALGLAGAVYGQEGMKGEVVTVDEASGKIGIRLSGTVGSGDTIAPTLFKVQDGLVFKTLKSGDKVTFTAEPDGGIMTIKKITKD